MASQESLAPNVHIDIFTARGGRSTQEDRTFISPIENTERGIRGYFVAILDGHGGAEAADAIIEMLPLCMPFLENALNTKPQYAHKLLRGLCMALHDATRHCIAGTTFTCAIVDLSSMLLHVANLGDSALLHTRKRKTIAKTTAHNARTNVADRNLIVARGARYERGYLYHGEFGLQCTRTLGDRPIPELIREPEIFTSRLKRGDNVILLTDGVISTSDDIDYSEEAYRIACLLTKKPPANAEDITYHGMEIREAHDNATTILLRIES